MFDAKEKLEGCENCDVQNCPIRNCYEYIDKYGLNRYNEKPLDVKYYIKLELLERMECRAEIKSLSNR